MGLPRLLITGSRGKIGMVLMKGLADSFAVYGLDLLARPKEHILRADISDYDQLTSVMREIAPLPYIIHLAADARVGASWKSVLRNNIIGTKNLYEAARAYKVNKVIFASSNHVTGAYEGIPPSLHEKPEPRIITANDPVRPDSDYGTSKVFGEAVARQYYELCGIQSVCLRIGTFLADNNPTRNERVRKTWLSHRDLIQLVKKSIMSQVEFGIYYGVSKNKGRFWDISKAEKEIDYHPEDDASAI
jgi:nucleoside-diphosphate-sugar epimerase